VKIIAVEYIGTSSGWYDRKWNCALHTVPHIFFSIFFSSQFERRRCPDHDIIKLLLALFVLSPTRKVLRGGGGFGRKSAERGEVDRIGQG
jgi:hypothetical protein